MSLDRSLKAANSLIRHRNVLKRDERIERLMDEEKWNDQRGVLGMPKVANRKAALVKTVKEATDGDAAAPAAAGKGPAGKAAAGKAAPTAGAKAPAPATKAAAPAAKKK